MEGFRIPATMKAMTLVVHDQSRLAEVPVPEPRLGEVSCRIRSVVICGPDPKMIHGGHRSANWPPYHPFIMGYE